MNTTNDPDRRGRGHGIAAATIALAATLSLIPLVASIWLRDAEIDAILAGIWTTVTAWGVISTTWTVRDSWLERRDRRDKTDRALKLIADANVRREVVRLVVLVGLFYVGLSIVGRWSDPTVNRLVIITIALALVSNSILDRLERRETARALRAARDAERTEYQG